MSVVQATQAIVFCYSSFSWLIHGLSTDLYELQLNMLFFLAKNTSKSIVNPVSHLLYAPTFYYETILLNLLFTWIITLLFSMVKVHSFFKIPIFSCSLHSTWQLFFHNEALGEYLWHLFSHSSHLPFSVGILFWYIFLVMFSLLYFSCPYTFFSPSLFEIWVLRRQIHLSLKFL